ncbi:hypothetical protein [Alloalcanivorax xenomutans]|uniref:Glycosyl transferase family 1 domain-containing protein n=1 Tax=Alloalcanivorax xenomutans TaxID=1094342 RepID=A0A9Q3W4I4_9GAMM|nr:hypothetical protein [Alloalcanivorax xenomutans]MCE7507672.1 hypothetical protein [Alloalcanivorax xenomutans]
MQVDKMIIGGLPEPIGGVSSFLYRFATHCMGENDLFLDLYKAKTKYVIPKVKVKNTPFNNWLFRYIFIVINLFTNVSRVVHFHFSGIRSCYIFLFIPKRSERWILTLHSGKVGARLGCVSRFDKYFFKKVLAKFEVIHAISDQQVSFYLDYVEPQRVIRAPTYIPPSAPLLSQACTEDFVLQEQIGKMKSGGGHILMTSGYPSRIYNFDKFQSGILMMGDGYYGVVVVYGPGSEEYVSMQQGRSVDDRVLWVSGLTQPQFLRLQKEIDCYVRLTESDSFGIAVADSIELGTPVLATDVCKRYPGTVTIPSHDVEHWTRYLPVKMDLSFGCAAPWGFLSVVDTLYG